MKMQSTQEKIDRLIERLEGSIEFKAHPLKILKAIRQNKSIID